MKRFAIAAASAVLVCLGAATAAAQGGLLDAYVARLGTDDHFNSRGVRLTDPAAIIRQDRANFHAFGIRDVEDEGDVYFASMENRARLEAMIRRGTITPAARRAIVDGTPLVHVEIYPDHVNVDVR